MDRLFSKANPVSLAAVRLEFGAGLSQAVASPGVALFDSFNTLSVSRPRRVEERRLRRRGVREQATELAAGRVHPAHFNNNDEVRYPPSPSLATTPSP